MKHEDSLPRLQVPATCSYPEPHQSNSCPYPTSWRSVFMLSSHLFIGLSSSLFPSGLLHQNPARTSPAPQTCHIHYRNDWAALDPLALLYSLWNSCKAWHFLFLRPLECLVFRIHGSLLNPGYSCFAYSINLHYVIGVCTEVMPGAVKCNSKRNAWWGYDSTSRGAMSALWSINRTASLFPLQGHPPRDCGTSDR
jgi:hypothetical protein